MLAVDELGHGSQAGSYKSVASAMIWIVLMNIVFSFDTVLSAIALTREFWSWPRRSWFPAFSWYRWPMPYPPSSAKNRMYELLALFVLLLVGIMLMSEGGHIAHLAFIDYEIVPMAKSSEYFGSFALLVARDRPARYQRKLLDEPKARRRKSRKAMAEPPLKGVRVIELARILAGPWAGQLLADLGADVIKVENPDGGDDTAQMGTALRRRARTARTCRPPITTPATAASARSPIDFSTPEGAETVRKLVATADVLIENFKLGGLKKYGLDYESLRSSTRASSIARSPASARTGPYAPRAGYDFIIQGMSGMMSITGAPAASRRRRASPSPTSSPASMRSSPSRRRCATPKRPAKASSSTWRCSTRRSRCSPTRTSTTWSPASRRCRWATRT